MRVLGNLLWMLCGGLVSAFSFACCGLLLCLTVIGIPWGKQCFKLASLSLNPFGKEVETVSSGITSSLLNLLWILLFGWEFAAGCLITGLLLCITVIGIPFGKQFFKIASVAFLPFGKEIRTVHVL